LEKVDVLDSNNKVFHMEYNWKEEDEPKSIITYNLEGIFKSSVKSKLQTEEDCPIVEFKICLDGLCSE